MQRPTDAQSPQETHGISQVTLTQRVGNRTITLTYDDPMTDATTLARLAGMAMALLVSANRARPLQFQSISDEKKKALIAEADQRHWDNACSNPDPEERVA